LSIGKSVKRWEKEENKQKSHQEDNYLEEVDPEKVNTLPLLLSDTQFL